MERSIYCRQCASAYPAVGKWPLLCPVCHQTAQWRVSLEPRVDYVLNAMDRRFLRSIRIGSDEADSKQPDEAVE